MNKESTISTIREWLGHGSINVFGLPFSGKDTQAKKLGELFNAPTISGGRILREQQHNPKLQQILATGDLVPSELFEEIVISHLSSVEFANRPLMLSSVGRWFGEEHVIMRATETAGHPLRAVVLLEMPESAVWERFDASQALDDRGNRSDDHREILQNRIDEFNEKTRPVIDFYRDNNLLITVDGTKSRDDVASDILTELAKKAK